MRKVYFDNASTNCILPEVKEAMLPYLGDFFGNPSSLHDWGDPAREALETARKQVTSLINGVPQGIIFTSCGTESNNLAIKGLALARQKKGKHVVLSGIEHFSVLYAAKTLSKNGFEVTLLPVDEYGRVSPKELRGSMRPDTVLVSIMHASNEVGTIQPVKELAQIAHENEAVFHIDAVASAGLVPIDVEEMGVDALSLAANQFYGPKGAAALWVKPGVRIIPQMDGGIQEEGWRPGTENVPAIAGMGKAAEIALIKMEERAQVLSRLRDRLINELPLKLGHTDVTGHPTDRLPGHASFVTRFIEGEAMLMLLNSRGIAASSGSACTSRALKASHVLTGMGVPVELAQGSIVFTLGIDNNDEDIDYVLEEMPAVVERLRQMSPLYSKYQQAQ